MIHFFQMRFVKNCSDLSRFYQSVSTPIRDTGNAMDITTIAKFNDAIDIEALRAYRLTVGRGTREIVKQLKPEDLKRKVEPYRMKKVMDEGAVVEAARGIADYWSKRNIAGLLLMPATRHHLVHLNEALHLKRRISKDV
jgi:hypothetical protein